jgi:hypothetical protein
MRHRSEIVNRIWAPYLKNRSTGLGRDDTYRRFNRRNQVVCEGEA